MDAKDNQADAYDLKIKTTSGGDFEIPAEGSLGLLALGDIGLMAWRKKKQAIYQASQNKKQNP